MKRKIPHMGCESVVSIAAVIEHEELQNAIILSDCVRNETLRRCYAIPSYIYKSRKWQNRYYDTIKRKVEAELNVKENRA